MSVEIFGTEEFEVVLPEYFIKLSPTNSEIEYLIPFDPKNKVGIMVRSSISTRTLLSAATGEDSIRAWLVTYDDNYLFPDTKAGYYTSPLGSKVTRWTTRLPGWRDRLKSVIKTLMDWRRKAGNCTICNNPKSIFRSKTKKNPNRVFAKCPTHSQFEWIT